MGAFLNLKTSTKLVVAFATLSVIFLVLLGLLSRNLDDVQSSQQRLFQEHVQQLLDIKQFRTDVNAARAYSLTLTLERDPVKARDLLQKMTAREAANEERLKSLLAQVAENTRRGVVLREINRVWRDSQATRLNQVMPAFEAGRYEEAQQLVIGIQADRAEQLRDLGEEFNQVALASMDAELQQNAASLNAQKRNLFFAVPLVLLLITLFIWSLNKAIAIPLNGLTKYAERIARGDLSTPYTSNNRRDEVGLLSQAFVSMSAYLQHLADRAQRIAHGDLSVTVEPRSERDTLGQAFATMVENLRHLISELNAGIAVLGSASQQILATTTQMAAGAQETATAVSEITTTIEEVKQTANVASQKARNVSDAAQQAVQVSLEGREAVEATLEGMRQIREQTQAVSESIVRLNEQSQAIGEIVATVGDLAEQSNLLGVNASIEAIKAGEHGKGFSVVAQEVKSLAEQSRQATAQVRSILNDIQKAMNKAVLVTEQGSRAVEDGNRQAQRSGEAIKDLADSIDASAGAALQIAASSQQQLVGMDQIAQAMSSIQQASEDNVAGARQSEQAARDLHQLGLKLKERAATFRLDDLVR